jgi:PrcB C-terminal
MRSTAARPSRPTRPFRTARRSTCTSLAALALLLVAGCGSTPRDVPYTDLTRQAGPLEFTRITRDVFRSRAGLLDVLERNNPGRTIRLPNIDFSRHEIYLVAAGPRSSTGYELEVVRVRDEGDHIDVVVHERTPSLGDRVQARVTYPFVLISLPRSKEPVKLKWPGRP